ncbi:MAG: hypothetical protein HPY90_14890 [Syntrophothermus sp.]|uniref:type II toxin-antitoxin system RelE family toxin n=1 Tax=Syntrophothermus sp. TaxID=2736299 RepID=UPI00258087CF|nr:hypothetical protein [Syntrophothermus sp.]NSW84498.1 hypothetical protein [Syntrophothermus sp.]
MSWKFEVIFSPRAKRHLKALDRSVQTRIKEAVANNLVCFPPRGDVIKLEGGKGTELRLRIGVEGEKKKRSRLKRQKSVYIPHPKRDKAGNPESRITTGFLGFQHPFVFDYNGRSMGFLRSRRADLERTVKKPV